MKSNRTALQVLACIGTVIPRLLLFGGLIGPYTTLTTTAAITGNTPWVVIKCKFSDQVQEPAFDPAFITGNNGLAGYWRDVSNGHLSIDGTEIYGWFTLPFTLEESMSKNRRELIQACKDAAPRVDFSRFYSIIAILNATRDSGSDGLGQVLLDPGAWNISFAAHEMGHGYTLDHSFDDTGTVYSPGNDNRPGAYGNSWDIMSAMTFGGSNPTFGGQFGRTGPGLNAPNMDTLGWLPAQRVSTWNREEVVSRTITLAALNHPEANGFLMARIPVSFGDWYTIEFRRQTGWDAGIPQDTVLIHEARPDGLNYLLRGQGGAERLAGETYHDGARNIAIGVLNIDVASSTATISVGKSEAWVDFSWPGLPNAPENGSSGEPFNSVAEGVGSVAHGGTVKFRPGSTPETGTINKRVNLLAVGGRVIIGAKQ